MHQICHGRGCELDGSTRGPLLGTTRNSAAGASLFCSISTSATGRGSFGSDLPGRRTESPCSGRPCAAVLPRGVWAAAGWGGGDCWRRGTGLPGGARCVAAVRGGVARVSDSSLSSLLRNNPRARRRHQQLGRQQHHTTRHRLDARPAPNPPALRLRPVPFGGSCEPKADDSHHIRVCTLPSASRACAADNATLSSWIHKEAIRYTTQGALCTEHDLPAVTI